MCLFSMASPDIVSRTKIIDNWFNEYVYKWMYNDLRRAIDAGANYLAALGIAVYSEALMQFEYPGEDKGQLRFDKFLELMPDEYRKVDTKLKSLPRKEGSQKKDGIYNRVRCGLAHEYFVKKNAIIYREAKGEIPCGIIYIEADDELIIVLETYFSDFKNAAENLHKNLMEKPQFLTSDKVVRESGNVISLGSGASGDWLPFMSNLNSTYEIVEGKLVKKTK